MTSAGVATANMRSEWTPEQVSPQAPPNPRAAYRYVVKVDGRTVFQTVNYRRAVRQCEHLTDNGERAKIVTVPVYR